MDEAQPGIPPLIVSELNPPLNTRLITDGTGLEHVRSFLARVTEYGFDYETNVVDDFKTRKARTLQIGDRNEQYVIDLLAFADGNTELLQAAQGNDGSNMHLSPGLCLVRDTLAPSLCSKSHLKIGQYLAFEYTVSRYCLGMRIWNLFSIDIAEKLLLAGLVPPMAHGHFALDDMVAKYVRKTIDKTKQTSFDLATPLTPEQVDYAALDTRLPLAVRKAQLVLLKNDGLLRAAQLEMDSIGSFCDLHINGILIDKSKWLGLLDETRKTHEKNVQKLDTFFLPVAGKKEWPEEGTLDKLEATWRDLGTDSVEELELKQLIKEFQGDQKVTARARKNELKLAREATRRTAREAFMSFGKRMTKLKKEWPGWEGEAAINYDSPDQVHAALLKMKGFTATKLPTTNDDVLKKHAGNPVIDALREYRTSKKSLKSYGDDWARTYDELDEKGSGGWIHPEDGRIHSNFNQLGAGTGRTSSSSPNIQNLPKEDKIRACFVSRPGYKIVTVDMSGAELRIIAEYSGASTWVDAFNKGWDIHSVSTEILYPDKWPLIGLPDCAYFTKDHKKCNCPAHKELRDGTKATNFLLCYGGGPTKLAQEIGKTTEEAKVLMGKHEKAFTDVWNFLSKSGRMATMTMQARSMCGRRRLFKRPTWDDAKVKATEKIKEKEDVDRAPTTKEISKQLGGMNAAIEREGKNMPIQGSNADIAKLAMGCGFDPDGKPYLWHILPQYGAVLVNFVHDEFVVEVPDEHAQAVYDAIGDCIVRAGGEFMKKVRMEFEGHIDTRWRK